MPPTRLLRLPITGADGAELAHLFVPSHPVTGAEAADLPARELVAEVVAELGVHDLLHDRTVILPGLPQLLGHHDLAGLGRVELGYAIAYDELAADETLEGAVQAQRRRGRTVLVSGVATVAQIDALAGFADGVVVDIAQTGVDALATLAPAAETARMVVLVVGVRSEEERAECLAVGVMGTTTVTDPASGRDGSPVPLLPPRRVNVEELDRLLGVEKVAMEAVDEVVTGDAGLTLALLEQIRRPVIEGPSPDVGSVPQGLLLLGRDTVRRWAATMSDGPFADRHERETSSMILIRARFCQGLARLTGDASSDEAFLAGLLAGVVDLLHVDPVALLDRVASSAAVSDALLHGHGPLAGIIAIARAHGTSLPVAREAGLSPLEVMRTYLDAVSATGRTMRGMDEDGSDTDPVVSRPNQGELRRRLGVRHRVPPGS